MHARKLILLILVATALGSAGCSDPVLGEWRSTEKLNNGERNQLWFYDDGSGEATLWATPEGQPENWSRLDFKHRWQDKGDSFFELDMQCDDNICNGDDFTMNCDGVERGGGELFLSCEGDGKWSKYVFNWEPRRAR